MQLPIIASSECHEFDEFSRYPESNESWTSQDTCNCQSLSSECHEFDVHELNESLTYHKRNESRMSKDTSMYNTDSETCVSHARVYMSLLCVCIDLFCVLYMSLCCMYRSLCLIASFQNTKETCTRYWGRKRNTKETHILWCRSRCLVTPFPQKLTQYCIALINE